MSVNIKNLLLIALIVAFFSCSTNNDSSTSDTNSSIKKLEYNLSHSCNYSGQVKEAESNEIAYAFKSDEEAEKALNLIMRQTGLPANFELIATDMDNAAAVIRDNKRYLIYGQTFMEEVKTRSKSKFGPLSILAHEIGHHLSGHTLMEGGSRPILELEADRFSGFILAKLGASMNEACAAINEYGSDSETSSHPAKKSRIAAIINGWKEGKESRTNTEIADPSFEKKKYVVNAMGGYIVIRNRSLSPDEFRTANSGTSQAVSINQETIITNLNNGTAVEVLSSTGNTFFVRTTINNKPVEGFISKKLRGKSTIESSN